MDKVTEHSTSTYTSKPQETSRELVCEEQLQASKSQPRVLPGNTSKQRANSLNDLLAMIRCVVGGQSAGQTHV